MFLKTADALNAIDAGEFQPYFQALTELRTGRVSGFEVLARWFSPALGAISPDEFIPAAEKEGWIGPLSRDIFRKAFLSAKELSPELTLSVNVSPVQLQDASLPTQLETLSEETGFPLTRVLVEITETALAHNLAQARAICLELKSLGCKLGLDDFGTGYSSLTHLQSLPFDELKVDRSFVRMMTEQRESRKIVGAVIGLGQSLGLTTVAEGIETQEHADMLLWLGCDLGQGWLFGRPVAAENLAATAMLQSRQFLDRDVPFPTKDFAMGNFEGLPSQRLAQLQAVYNGAPVGLGFVDRSLKYINLNQKLAEIHRAPIEEHIGRTVPEMAASVFAQIGPYMRRALQGEAIADVEVTVADIPSQKPKTYLASYQPARDEAGEVVGVSCAVTDFTARKRDEERLRQYERLVASLDEMIAVIDRNYRFELANHAFLDYHQLTTERLIGRSVEDLVEPSVFKNVLKEKLDICFAGSTVNFRMQYKFPTRGNVDLLISYVPIEQSGLITGAACVLRDVTELMRMERADSEWNKRLELAQQAGLQIGLWDWDLGSNAVLWSDETYRQWGFTRNTFSGRVEDAVARIHPEDSAHVCAAIQKVLSGESDSYAVQYRVVRPDGTICWIDAHGVILRGESHMLGVGVDITSLKRIQESLQKSEEESLLLLNSTAEAIYGLDLEGNCTFCNPACVQMLGYGSPEDLLGKNMHSQIHHTRANGKSYGADQCLIYKAMREGSGVHTVEEVLWRADGTSFPAEHWSYPMYKNGKLVGAVVTFLDISERRQAEEARRESELQYRELFENATYGMLRSTDDGTLLNVNQALVKMLGYGSREELLSKNMNTDVYEDPNVRASLLKAVCSDARVEFANASWKRRDGRTISVHLSGRAIHGRNGSKVYEVIAEDITERKTLEQQVRQAQKMEAVGQLAGGIAHDFNNLLTVINGYSDLLLSELHENDSTRESILRIREAGERSATLTRQLLTFSRKTAATALPIRLDEVVTSFESMLRQIIGEHVVLSTTLHSGPTLMRADPGQIEQIIMNLALNARDAMPNGGRIAIRTSAVDFDSQFVQTHLGMKPGRYVVLTVADTGTGIADEVQERMFEPFFTTKGPERGTGLGLAVVHGIIRDCEGYISVDSHNGRGTSFTMYFPAVAHVGGPNASAPSSDEAASIRPGVETILLVEDNDSVRELARDILLAEGYTVIDAADGVEGRRMGIQAELKIDLLATDVVMPELGGRDLADQLRSINPNLKIMYMSGYTDDPVIREGILDHEIDFLEKPFTPTALTRKVRAILDGRSRSEGSNGADSGTQ